MAADADRSRRYVLHAVNRVAEIFLAHSNGTLISGNLGLTRISLQNLMSVTSVISVSSLVASEPVSLCGCCYESRGREWFGRRAPEGTAGKEGGAAADVCCAVREVACRSSAGDCTIMLPQRLVPLRSTPPVTKRPSSPVCSFAASAAASAALRLKTILFAWDALQTGYYDLQSKRYVLLWLATAPAQDAEPLMFVAVSQGSDPLGQWVVKGLRVKPSGITFKCGHAGSATEEPFFANYPQVGLTGCLPACLTD